MIHPLRDLGNKRRFRKAKAEAKRSGEIVCGYLDKTGRPVYFTAAPEAAEEEVAARVFEDYYGRSITNADLLLAKAAKGMASR